jgi:Holliday junction resolvasome RuvABC endonuclease subunit
MPNNILALDQASRTSGWAVFCENNLIASGTFTYDDDNFSLRLVKIRNKVISLIHEYCITKVLLEDIQLQG